MPNRVSFDQLRRSRPYVLLLAFVVSTLVESLVHQHAPPDVISMTVMAMSMYLFFEAGLVLARFFKR